MYNNLKIECLEEGSDCILELEDSHNGTEGPAGRELLLTIQDWSDKDDDEPQLLGISLDEERAMAIIDYLAAFYRLGGLH